MSNDINNEIPVEETVNAEDPQSVLSYYDKVCDSLDPTKEDFLPKLMEVSAKYPTLAPALMERAHKKLTENPDILNKRGAHKGHIMADLAVIGATNSKETPGVYAILEQNRFARDYFLAPMAEYQQYAAEKLFDKLAQIPKGYVENEADMDQITSHTGKLVSKYPDLAAKGYSMLEQISKASGGKEINREKFGEENYKKAQKQLMVQQLKNNFLNFVGMKKQQGE
jgi:hypothetical protein